ncbi:MAG: hypothetical protein IH864_07900 [Chloroflexi bacterium]|nr:hypothetical protein [Chloroflexota bacterium]
MAQKTEDQAQEDVEEPKADAVDRVTSGLRSSLPQLLLLGRTRPPPGQPRPYEPRIATLSESRAAAHLRAVKDITAARFGFPTDRYKDFKTYTNIPQRSMGVAMPDGAIAYPDIVVVQNPENYAKLLGEVETAETVTERVARRRWLPFAQLAPLYLYVPVGEGDRAQKLSRDLKVPIVGIRTWRYTVGVDQIEINDHYTVPSGPEEMLPKILRPG